MHPPKTHHALLIKWSSNTHSIRSPSRYTCPLLTNDSLLNSSNERDQVCVCVPLRKRLCCDHTHVCGLDLYTRGCLFSPWYGGVRGNMFWWARVQICGVCLFALFPRSIFCYDPSAQKSRWRRGVLFCAGDCCVCVYIWNIDIVPTCVHACASVCVCVWVRMCLLGRGNLSFSVCVRMWYVSCLCLFVCCCCMRACILYVCTILVCGRRDAWGRKKRAIRHSSFWRVRYIFACSLDTTSVCACVYACMVFDSDLR